MDSEKKLSLSNGYQIIEKNETVDLDQAFILLNSRKQCRYTTAEKKGDAVMLTKHILVCPRCGKEVPAYGHFLSHKKHPSKKSAQELADWIWPQTTLFGGEKRIALALFQPEAYDDEFRCPKCKRISHPATRTFSVSIRSTGRTVTISRTIDDISELMNIGWKTTVILGKGFPLLETLSFDFHTGATTLQLLDEDNSVLCWEELTDFEQRPEDIAIFKLCENNKLAVRYIRQGFARCWGSPLPFAPVETSLTIYILMTKYIGFPICFYDAIPYNLTAFKVEGSFESISEQLHTASDAVALYKKSSLPCAKSIRRVFFQRPGLLFYVKECEIICRIIEDINLLQQFFSSGSAFDVLSIMHAFPGISKFFEDYCKVKQAYTLCHRLIERPRDMCGQAVCYYSMSEERRCQEMDRWKRRRDHDVPYQRNYILLNPEWSIPMHPIPEGVGNCKINEYSFIWLRTYRDYFNAGVRLDNCLKSWGSKDNPVIGVFRYSRIIAAVEVDGNTIVQAMEYNNRDIAYGSPVYFAIKAWCKGHGLVLGKPLKEYLDWEM